MNIKNKIIKKKKIKKCRNTRTLCSCPCRLCAAAKQDPTGCLPLHSAPSLDCGRAALGPNVVALAREGPAEVAERGQDAVDGVPQAEHDEARAQKVAQNPLEGDLGLVHGPASGLARGPEEHGREDECGESLQGAEDGGEVLEEGDARGYDPAEGKESGGDAEPHDTAPGTHIVDRGRVDGKVDSAGEHLKKEIIRKK